jgi:hydroxyacyl-ACP dehydratase HTD2-like protein with hotdog domain
MAEPLFFEDVAVGQEIPVTVESVSEVQMFLFSAATYNAHRIHYDLPYATKVEGLPGLLVHGPLQAALLAKRITDWMGPAGQLRRIQIQNRGSAFPHEKLFFGGKVTAKREVDGEGWVECEIFERNERGDVLMPGTATVQLPRR